MIPRSDYQKCIYALEARLIVFARQIESITAVIALKDALTIEKNAWVAVLEARVTELEAILNVPNENSQNSSFCPTPDHKPYKLDNNAVKKKRKDHGKEGHLLYPNQTFEMKFVHCSNCGGGLDEAGQQVHSAYNKIKLPKVVPIVTSVHLYKRRCKNCGLLKSVSVSLGHEQESPFTDSLTKEPSDLKNSHFMSYKRFSTYVYRFHAIQGDITSIFRRYTGRFDTWMCEILERIQRLSIACSNKTGTRVLEKIKWDSVFQNENNLLHIIRPSRGDGIVKEYGGASFPIPGI